MTDDSNPSFGAAFCFPPLLRTCRQAHNTNNTLLLSSRTIPRVAPDDPVLDTALDLSMKKNEHRKYGIHGRLTGQWVRDARNSFRKRWPGTEGVAEGTKKKGRGDDDETPFRAECRQRCWWD